MENSLYKLTMQKAVAGAYAQIVPHLAGKRCKGVHYLFIRKHKTMFQEDARKHVAYTFKSRLELQNNCSRNKQDYAEIIDSMSKLKPGEELFMVQFIDTTLPNGLYDGLFYTMNRNEIKEAHRVYDNTCDELVVSLDEMKALSQCAHCGCIRDRRIGHAKVCSRCRSERYCSRECQVAHWPIHKQTCCCS